MSTKTNKLKTKDLIVAGAFAALYVVVLFAVVTVMGFVPILYLIAPFVNSVILGCIYMMYVTKVPKTGAILILSVAVGLLTSTGGVWVSLIWCLTLGIVAELIARAGNHKSKNPTYSAMLFLPAPAWHLSGCWLTPNRLFFSPAKLIMGLTMPQRWISSHRAGSFWF